MKLFFGNTIFYTLIYFIFLFDKDGAQLGLSLFSNVPDGLVLTASILGNVLWLFGVLFLLVGVVLFVLVVNDDESTTKTIKENPAEKLEKMTEKPKMVLVTIAIFTAMFGVGSGFWFTGLSWLIMMGGVYSWRYVLTKAYDEYLKEKGETRTDSVEGDLKKSLLD